MIKKIEYKPRYTIQQLNFNSLYSKISKPKIQRGAVWTQKKQNELIETIKKGFPIGTFLLLRTKGKYEYEVLDGQQRYTTLCNYKDNASSFMRKDDVDIELLIRNLIKETSDSIIKKTLKNSTEYYIKKKNRIYRIFKDNKGEISSIAKEITNLICDKNQISKRDIRNNFKYVILDWVESCVDRYEIDDLNLPCIILDNKLSDDEKADAFITMNTPGTKLTKYDYYAAKWNNEKDITCSDRDIISKINERYSEKFNKQVKYTYPAEYSLSKTNKVKVFEYVYALSKIIDDQINTILEEPLSNDNKVATLGFILVSETLGVESTKMDNLPKSLLNIKNLNDYQQALLNSVSSVFNKLKESFTAPDKSVYLDHTENQIASFIISYFKLSYTIDHNGYIQTNKSAKKDTSVLFENIVKHYIYDNISDFWSGTGDKKMSIISKDVANSRYMNDIDKEKMRDKVEEWINDKNDEDDINPLSDTKMFISYILHSRCKGLFFKKMQWEHICIKDKLINSGCKNGMSSPTCVTLIPRFDNESKGILTYYEYEKSKDSIMKNSKDELEKLLYPAEKEIKFVQGASKTKISAKEYEKFKQKRTKLITDIFINTMYH